ncbi:MAG: LytTR family DNA-binding domain-containing protein [Flavobacterium sp. JAD_PAG50586_2]|nr:MAG: LytTR family DNA-binding domain-containing protein [Flavobacterium sp. JAD_PAG50586_2]
MAEAHGIDDAIAVINLHNPELLLLDINLGEREVFEIFREIHCTPQIVFISSEGKYALNAFRYDATDFVLKPINREILISAISKAISRLEQQRQFVEMGYSIWSMNNTLKSFITVSSVDRHEIIKIQDIMHCSSEGRYTTFHLNDGRDVVACKNLSEYEHIFEKQPFFVKISRSQIVNFEYVARVNKKNGMYCEIKDGVMIPVARRKYTELNKFLSELE